MDGCKIRLKDGVVDFEGFKKEPNASREQNAPSLLPMRVNQKLKQVLDNSEMDCQADNGQRERVK